MMKRLLPILICLGILLTIVPVSYGIFDDEENELAEDQRLIEENEEYEKDASYNDSEEVIDTPEDIEEPYIDGNTVYNFEDEVETPPIPVEEPPPEDTFEEDNESEIYNDFSFDEETSIQLNSSEYVLDEIIIKFKEPWQVPGKEKQLQHEIDKVEKVGFIEELGVYVISVDDLDKNPNAVLNRFKNNKYIEYVEPNYVIECEFIPNDERYSSQSNAANIINAPIGWDIIKGDSGTMIAVIDTGVANHPDLPPLVDGYSVQTAYSPNNDAYGHGTKVAGVIGAIGNNGIGTAGINWNASIIPIKMDNGNGSFTAANMAKAIIWAADNGARIISISAGTTADGVTLRNAINYAYGKGCAIFAATGNEGKSLISYPARYQNVFGVGSTSDGSSRAALSNYGDGLDVVASDIYYSTTTAGSYSAAGGTSIATPQVAGLASLVWAVNPNLTNDEVYELIRQGAKTLGDGVNEETGYGVIDMGKTLELAQAMVSSSSDAAARAKAEAEAKAAEEAEARAAAEVEAKAKAEAEAVAKAAAEAEAKAKAEAEAAAKAAEEAEAKAKAEAEAEAAAKAQAEAEAKAAAEAAAKAEEEAKAAADAAAKAEEEAKAAAEAAAKAEAEAKAAAEAAAKAAEKAKPETPQEIRTSPLISLTGFAELTLEYGQAYIEKGYSAIDCKGVDLSSSVKVTGTVDIWKAGLYTITYEVADVAGLTARATRTVIVNPQPPAPPPPTAPKITIIGSNPIILHLTSGTPYKEQMARAVDGDGTDISSLVTVSGAVNRNAAGTYTLTYTITSPTTGLSSSTTRNVRIVAPTERKDPRTSYGLSGQAKTGAKVTHTGIVSSALGFIDLKVSSIDKNMTIYVDLVDTATKKAVLSDTFTATGTKQYKIDQGRYELVVTIGPANGNSKYSIDLLMPEAAPTLFFNEAEVPLFGTPHIAPIGSNPIVLHINGTSYVEQGARAVDYLGNDISDQVVISGAPNTSREGTYVITYSVPDPLGGDPISVTRDVRIINPLTGIYEEEVPIGEADDVQAQSDDAVPQTDAASPQPDTITYVVVKGDSLWKIALKQYGDGARWPEIYAMNRSVIGGNPDHIDIGMVLTLKTE